MKQKNILLSLTATLMLTSALFVRQAVYQHKEGDFVGQIKVTDKNIGCKFTFEVLKGNKKELFKIDDHGNIHIHNAKEVNRLAGKNIELLVRVCDNGVRYGHLHDKQIPYSVVPPQCSEATITIMISRISKNTRIK